jgi:ribosomal protein S16
MALKIRLKRMGMKKSPFYRLVVAEATAPRDGRFVDEIGTYNPVKQPAVITVDEEKALKWRHPDRHRQVHPVQGWRHEEVRRGQEVSPTLAA